MKIIVALLGLLLLPSFPVLADLQCTPNVLSTTSAPETIRHAKGLLWKISKSGVADSYLFGTMHIADQKVTNVPQTVISAIESSNVFMMEAVLDGVEMMGLMGMMFYTDGSQLSDQIGMPLYEKTTNLLVSYGFPAEMAQYIKPWAAFLILSGPKPDGGMPLDLVLMNKAKNSGKQVLGIETLIEQGQLFEGLSLADQVALLQDSVCQYDVIGADIQEMKIAYLAGDLASLYALQYKYKIDDQAAFDRMMDALIWQRNHRMFKRVSPYLQQGNTFIAVGALHLPGQEGLLTILEQNGYQVTAIY